MSADPKNNDPPRSVAKRWRKRQNLDGRPRSLPRGRHAKPRNKDDDEAKREAVAVPVHQRLGFRPAEFAALIGVSYVTVWRQIKAKKIEVVEQNGMKIIPRSYAVKAGYITADGTAA